MHNSKEDTLEIYGPTHLKAELLVYFEHLEKELESGTVKKIDIIEHPVVQTENYFPELWDALYKKATEFVKNNYYNSTAQFIRFNIIPFSKILI